MCKLVMWIRGWYYVYRLLNIWYGGLNLNRYYFGFFLIVNDMNINNVNKSVYC